MNRTSEEAVGVSPDPSTPLTQEEIYEVWLSCHQAMLRVHDRDEAEMVGDPEVRVRNIPGYFGERQRELAEYILVREALRAAGRC